MPRPYKLMTSMNTTLMKITQVTFYLIRTYFCYGGLFISFLTVANK